MVAKSTRLAFAAGFAGLAMASMASAGDNLVADGTFSNTINGFQTIGAGGNIGGAWSVSSGSVDLIGTYWQAPAGTGSVDMDGNSPGAIAQSLSLAAGFYTLTFDLSGNPDGGTPTKILNVQVGNANQDFTFTTGANSHANMGYVPEVLHFYTAGPTTLNFDSLDAGSSPFGPVIGDVVISAPEPAAWVMMLLGVGAIGAAARRRAGATLAKI